MTKKPKVGFATADDPLLKQFTSEETTTTGISYAKPEPKPVKTPAPQETPPLDGEERKFTVDQIAAILFKQSHQDISQSYNDLFFFLFKDNPDIVALKKKYDIPIWLYGSILNSFNADNQRYHISGRGNPVVQKKGKQ